MSSEQNSKALAKRRTPGSLMLPPPAPKRIKRPQIVLDEDTYTDSLAYIIRRDFFPGLAETDAQHEYLDALKSNDNSWIREAGKKLTQVMTPLPSGQRRKAPSATPGFGSGSATPKTWDGDTPVTVVGTEAEEGEAKKPEVDLNLSLSAFQAKYISEDQESFSKIIDKQNAKKFLENAWLRQGNRYASKQRLAQQKVLEVAKSTSNEVIIRPSQDLDKRPAAPNTHKHAPFNSLMFNPDSVEDWAPTRAQTAEAASLAPPKAIHHHNTRLLIPDPTEPSRPPSPSMSAVRDAIAGRPRPSQSEANAGSETPRVNGYTFVDTLPPEPGDADPVPKDLLEKFEVRANPSPFTIHDSDRREKLHHRMVERIGLNKKGKVSKSGSSSESGLGIFSGETPRFLTAPTPRLGLTPGRRDRGNLTPAARKLFERAGGSTPKGKGFGDGGQEWTPVSKGKRKG
ncbi:hypothetical protein CC78DRAFT_294610 [Lojkania enalia]|uniref:Nuclear protein DGCR14 n=1 Tax=Lojkania enalia TaxID=147567 RepID=A0A9P4KAA6_9PLEO|nr:hypothetical protein CC78DRAFT_294610 [Didymosphaeria enalia]